MKSPPSPSPNITGYVSQSLQRLLAEESFRALSWVIAMGKDQALRKLSVAASCTVLEIDCWERVAAYVRVTHRLGHLTGWFNPITLSEGTSQPRVK